MPYPKQPHTNYRLRYMSGSRPVKPDMTIFNYTFPQLIQHCKNNVREDKRLSHIEVFNVEGLKILIVDGCRAFDYQLGQYIG